MRLVFLSMFLSLTQGIMLQVARSIAEIALKKMKNLINAEEATVQIANELSIVYHFHSANGPFDGDALLRKAQSEVSDMFDADFWSDMSKEANGKYKGDPIYTPNREGVRRVVRYRTFPEMEFRVENYDSDSDYSDDEEEDANKAAEEEYAESDDDDKDEHPYTAVGMFPMYTVLALADSVASNLGLDARRLRTRARAIAGFESTGAFSDYRPLVRRGAGRKEGSLAEYTELVKSDRSLPAYWAYYLFQAAVEVVRGGRTLSDQVAFSNMANKVVQAANSYAQSLAYKQTREIRQMQQDLAERKLEVLKTVRALYGTRMEEVKDINIMDEEVINRYITNKLLNHNFAFFGRHALITRSEWMAVSLYAEYLHQWVVEVDLNAAETPLVWTERLLRLIPASKEALVRALALQVAYFPLKDTVAEMTVAEIRKIGRPAKADEARREATRRARELIRAVVKKRGMVDRVLAETPEAQLQRETDAVAWMTVMGIHNEILRLIRADI